MFEPMITGKQAISFAADLAAVALMIVLMIRTKALAAEKSSVKRYFRGFSWIVLCMGALHLVQSYAALQIGGLTAEEFGRFTVSEQRGWYLTAIAFFLIDIFFSAVFLCRWITFLSWFLYEDKDFIRRKSWAGFVPLIIGAAVTGVSIPLALLTEQGYRFYIAAIIAFFVIRMIYFLMALRLLIEYKKQNGYLRFFNPWVFFVPVFAGWLLQDVFEWGFSALGSTLGLMLLYTSIVAEERYLDRETGFYNRDFVNYLKELARKKKYAPCSAMFFTLDSAAEMKDFSKILKKQLPKDCEPILRSDCEITVLTNVRKRSPLAMVMGDVQAETDVRTDCTLKKTKETTESFMDRVIG